MDIIEAKAFRTFLRVYSLSKSERLGDNIKLTFHEALIRSISAYAFPAWGFAAHTYLLKLQRLQNKFPHKTGNSPRHIPTGDRHVNLKIPHVNIKVNLSPCFN